MILYDLEEERLLLAGILAHSDFFLSDIEPFISEEDFYSKGSIAHKTIFMRMRSLLEEGKKLDVALLAFHLKSVNLTFKDNITVDGFLEGLGLLSTSIDEESFKNAADIVKILSVRRSFSDAGEEMKKKMKSLDSSASYDEILDECDQIYNEKIELYENCNDDSVNLFDIMEDMAMERAADRSIYLDRGPLGPHDTINKLYGSLARPGNITTIVACSGVGKTQFNTHYCMHLEIKHGIPVLHLDNGEMSEEDIAFRMIASSTRIPLTVIESGKWADSSDTKKLVESYFKAVEEKGIKFHYYNVGGKNIDEILSFVKRFYHSKIKRGNKLIVNYDYIKSSFESGGYNKPEHQLVGEVVDKFKKVVHKDIRFENKPMIAVMTNVQANRSGTVGNRRSENLMDDEGVVSLTQRITQFSSHVFFLRPKAVDELQEDPQGFGEHKLIKIKARHFGEDFARAVNKVRTPDGRLLNNFINLQFDNFKVIDKGDLVDLIAAREEMNNLEATAEEEDLPI